MFRKNSIGNLHERRYFKNFYIDIFDGAAYRYLDEPDPAFIRYLISTEDKITESRPHMQIQCTAGDKYLTGISKIQSKAVQENSFTLVLRGA